MWYFGRFLISAAACAAALVALGLVVLGDGADSPQAAVGQQPATADSSVYFQSQFQPFLKKHCLGCHSGTEPESGVRLDHTALLAEMDQHRKVWEKALTMIRAGKMPPKDEPRPPENQSRQMADWLDHQLHFVDCDAPRDPGHVTIRRLTRVEYGNTVRDLLGVDFTLPDDFPADDVGYGFDNIGDVLTLPPLLMEKYLAAAEGLADRVLAEIRPTEGKPLLSVDGKKLRPTANGRPNGDGWWLYSNGEVFLRHAFRDAGEYLIRVHAEGDQAGDSPVEMTLSIDGRPVKTFEVKQHGRIDAFEHSVRIQPGQRRIAVSFDNDYYRPEASNPAQRDRNLFIGGIDIVGPRRQRSQADSRVLQKLAFVYPNEEIEPKAAAARIVRHVASRAFRRPATDAETARLVDLVESDLKRHGDFHQSVALALQAILVSPKFLFKVELNPKPGPGEQPSARLLNEYELATRLSYFLWSTMPDDRLFDLARSGSLRKNLPDEVRRMLKDPKSRALGENFALQWLGIRNLDSMQPDPQKFPSYSAELRSAMREETVRFFDALVREDRSVLALLDADFTFVNEALARHYGIGGVQGDYLRRVSVRGKPRGGILSQASVLTVTSNPTRTSPVKRGKWIMENVLGTPPADPPPDVPELEESEQAVAGASLRERLEMHRSDPNCAVCHVHMDPLGFGLENFDAVGRWRLKDGKFDIDASGTLPGGEEFAGPDQLTRLLREKHGEQFLRCFVEKMLTYAVGRGVEYYDRCTIDDVCEAVRNDHYNFSTLVLQLAESVPFQQRRAKKD